MQTPQPEVPRVGRPCEAGYASPFWSDLCSGLLVARTGQRREGGLAASGSAAAPMGGMSQQLLYDWPALPACG